MKAINYSFVKKNVTKCRQRVLKIHSSIWLQFMHQIFRSFCLTVLVNLTTLRFRSVYTLRYTSIFFKFVYDF